MKRKGRIIISIVLALVLVLPCISAGLTAAVPVFADEEWPEEQPELFDAPEEGGEIFIPEEPAVQDVMFEPTEVETVMEAAPVATVTVEFNMGGHGEEIEPVTVEPGHTLEKPDDPEEYGYTFVGWYLDPEFETEWDFEEDIVYEDMTLYALWEEVVQIIPEEPVISEEQIIPEEQVIPEVQVSPEEQMIPEVQVNPEEQIIPEEQVIPEEITIVNTDTVTKNPALAGTKPAPPLKAPSDEAITSVELSLLLPGEGGSYMGAVPADVSYKGEVNFTIDGAYWFKGEGEGKGLAPKKFEAGVKYFSEIHLIANGGYVFTDSTAVMLNEGDYVDTIIVQDSGNKLLVKTKNVEPLVNHTVTFDANGHGTAPEKQTVEHGKQASKPADPIEEGYSFGGWYTNAACKIEDEYLFTEEVNNDIILYAKWMVNVIGLKLHADGTKLDGTYYMPNLDTLEPVFEKDKESVESECGHLCTDSACSNVITTPPEKGTTYYFQLYLKDPSSYDTGIQKVMFLPEIINNIKASAEDATIELDSDFGTSEHPGLSGSPSGDSVTLQFKYTEKEIIYTISKGADATWTKGSSSGMDYIVNRNISDDKTYSLFKSIEMDGAAIAASNYEVSSGSLNATLNASYLETLSDGAHTVKFNFKDGSAETKLTIEPHVYNVKVNMEGSGTASASKTSGTTGTEISLTKTPEKGWQFKEWKVVSGGVTVTDDKFTIGTADVEITAVFERQKFKVTFTNEDGTVLQTGDVNYGDTPAYTGTTPAKAATAQYTYTFNKWTPDITAVTGDATYKATYNSTVNKYTIKFVNDDGTVLQSSDVEYGQTPKYTGTTPTKAADAQYTYTFKEWSPAIANVTKNATYTASYDKTPVPVNHTVVFDVNGYGTAPATQTVVDGEKAVKPADPTAAGRTFGGWYLDKACTKPYDFSTPVTADIRLYAKWTVGTLTPVPAGGGTAEAAKTGDNSHVVLWVVLLAAAAAALVVVLVKKKQMNKN